MQLEAADILACGRVERPLEKRGEPLATADMTSLRVAIFRCLDVRKRSSALREHIDPDQYSG
jgi:hypothetical protein